MLVRADFMAIEWSGWPAAGCPSSTSDVSGRGRGSSGTSSRTFTPRTSRGPGVPYEASCVFTARGGGRGGDGRPPGRRHCHRSHGRRDLRLGFVCPAGHPDRARSPHGSDRHPRQRHSHPAGLRVRDWLRVRAWLADRTDDQLRRWFHRPVVVPAHVSLVAGPRSATTWSTWARARSARSCGHSMRSQTRGSTPTR